jgi:hypothetical protein
MRLVVLEHEASCVYGSRNIDDEYMHIHWRFKKNQKPPLTIVTPNNPGKTPNPAEIAKLPVL